MQGAYYFLISGRVQGVCFRASAQDMARALGLNGWIRNREDGCVEGIACGPKVALNEFYEWLGHGPDAARVERVTFEPTTLTTTDNRFVIR